MTTKINVILLRKNKTVERRKVSPNQPFMKVRGNLYTVPKEAVNLIVYDMWIEPPNNPHAELIYVEGDPVPVSNLSTMKADTFLEKVVIENALKGAGHPKGFILEILGDYLKAPGKILGLTIVGIIVSAVIGGFLHWW